MRRRVADEPAYVLHHHDWSESSLILDVFTRHHGRLALVAKGVKRPHSSFRSVLLPLQALRLAYGGEGEVLTLKSAEWGGGAVMPTGEALWQGYYLNELVLRLLARDDPHPALFDAYAVAVQALAGGTDRSPAPGGADGAAPALRAFELQLLRECGLLPAMHCETATQRALHDAAGYRLEAAAGLVRVAQAAGGGIGSGTAIAGSHWLRLHAALCEGDAHAATVACAALPAAVQAALRAQLRQVLHYHCGTDLLRTQRVLQELQRV